MGNEEKKKSNMEKKKSDIAIVHVLGGKAGSPSWTTCLDLVSSTHPYPLLTHPCYCSLLFPQSWSPLICALELGLFPRYDLGALIQ